MPAEPNRSSRPQHHKPRPNGNGTIFKSRDRYRWQLRKEVGSEMQVVAQGTELTRKDAERACDRAVIDWDRGLLVIRSTVTLGEWLLQWLELRRPHIRETTFEQYEMRLRLYVPDQLRRMLLQEVKRPHILALEAALVRRLSATGRRMVITHLAAAFREAVYQEILLRNPAEGIKVTPTIAEKRKVKRRKALSDEEMDTFLRVAEHDPLYPVFYVLFSLGLRCGEALGLRWKDINWSTRTVSVVQAVNMLNHKPVIGELKSRSSRRDIPVTPDLLSVLNVQRGKQAELVRDWGQPWSDSGLVFTTVRGTPLDRHNIYRSIQRLCRLAGLEPFGTHSGRHTNLTNRMRQSQPLEVVSKVAGHARASITMDIYRHVMPDELRAAEFDLSAYRKRDGALPLMN
jgi:integrase